MKLKSGTVTRASVLLAAAVTLLGLGLRGGGASSSPEPALPRMAAATAPTRPAATPPWDRSLDPSLQEAATALRAGRCDEARTLVSNHFGRDGAEPSEARSRLADLIAGFHAHACGAPERAQQHLSGAADPGGPLEDWRLLVLGRSAHARGDEAAARRALTQLLSDHRSSPLWERGLVEEIERAAEAGEAEHALELLRWSRDRESLATETVGRIESVAWSLGEERGDLTVQTRAARRLLAHAPVKASELDVLEVFRRPDGEVAWRAVLSNEELEARGRALLRAGRVPEALDALHRVPEDRRGLDWTLAVAEALTRDDRPREALDHLDRAAPADGGELSAVAWARYRAYSDLASPLGAGAGYSADERRRLEEAAGRQLRRVASLHANRDLAAAALRKLFARHVEAERFEVALDVLRALRRLDPDDGTGADHLWNRGWREYGRKNYTGAVGYWAELASMYPDRPEARRGRYWTGRAFQHLGHTGRARDVFREIASSDVTDFYRKHALAHLVDSGTLAEPGDPEAPSVDPRHEWPTDPRLARARFLSDLGLDELALVELEVRGPDAERRARQALTALVLSRQGKHRSGIPHLRRAFPALGGPQQASVPPEVLRLYYPRAFDAAVRQAAERSQVPVHLVYGIIREESAFDVTALSHAGARGLMQLMPATGREVAHRLGLGYALARLDEPEYNVRLGATYFGQLLGMFDGRTELALAGYNGGPYRMKRLWRQAGPGAEMDYFLESLPVAESRNYVKRVLVFADSYERLYGLQ